MKITIEMACSINGFIATEDGKEDFLSNRNYQIMLDFLKEYDVLVWGRKTFDNVMSWGESYINDLKDTKVIVLSKSKSNRCNLDNVYYCRSIDECLTLCKELDLNKIFISGGANTNNKFMERNIVDELILNYNPYVLNKGIKLFEGDYFEKKLELIGIKKEQQGIVQIHYGIKK